MIKQYFERIAILKKLSQKLKREDRLFFNRKELDKDILVWASKKDFIYPLFKDPKGDQWFLSGQFDRT